MDYFEVITNSKTGEKTIRPYTPEEIAAIENAPIPVPQVVSRRQARLLLLQQGLLDQVEVMIALQDRATQITWADAIEFKRNDPLLLALAAAPELNLTSEQLDQFFIAAAQL